jgi:hypothetical protein
MVKCNDTGSLDELLPPEPATAAASDEGASDEGASDEGGVPAEQTA